MSYGSEITRQLRQVILDSKFNRSKSLEKFVQRRLVDWEFIPDTLEEYPSLSADDILRLALEFAVVLAYQGVTGLHAKSKVLDMGRLVAVFLGDLGCHDNILRESSWRGFCDMIADDRVDVWSKYPELQDKMVQLKA